ncbi:MAG: DUF5615 family PIN-like protein [Saprospiraceae bacterium]
MRFLVDAQLPRALSLLLSNFGFDSLHTLDLPQKNFSSDEVISGLTISENRILITKDTDFLDSFLLKAIPQKLKIIRTGNINNKALLLIFKNNIHHLKKLLDEGNLIEITTDNIILHK